MRVMTPLQFRTLPFEEAARHWLEIKKMHSKKPRTIEMYEWYVRNLSKMFAGVLLSQIHIGHFSGISAPTANGSRRVVRES
jgi:hypothetical protein